MRSNSAGELLQQLDASQSASCVAADAAQTGASYATRDSNYRRDGKFPS